jgi:hypothetical protein
MPKIVRETTTYWGWGWLKSTKSFLCVPLCNFQSHPDFSREGLNIATF